MLLPMNHGMGYFGGAVACCFEQLGFPGRCRVVATMTYRCIPGGQSLSYPGQGLYCRGLL